MGSAFLPASSCQTLALTPPGGTLVAGTLSRGPPVSLLRWPQPRTSVRPGDPATGSRSAWAGAVRTVAGLF